MRRSFVLIGGLAVVLIAVNLLIVSKEQLLRTGESIYLELAPTDPRSLMQGDYMRLDYRVARELSALLLDPGTRDGVARVRLDDRHVAELVDLYRSSTPLAANERLLRFRTREGVVRVGSPSFFFQEGQGPLYGDARYAELKLAPSGDTLLVGLRDAELRRLGTALDAPADAPPDAGIN